MDWLKIAGTAAKAINEARARAAYEKLSPQEKERLRKLAEEKHDSQLLGCIGFIIVIGVLFLMLVSFFH